MITKFKCLVCIVDDLRGAIDLLSIPSRQKEQILRESFKYLSQNFSLKLLPSEMITEVHRIVKKITRLKTPFAKLREACNEVGLKLAPQIEKDLTGRSSFKRFEQLIRWSIAGNHLDFRTVGTGYGFKIKEIEELIKRPFAEGLKVNQLAKIYKLVKQSQRILFVHDNVGEIVFDKLLIQELKRYGVEITSALRGGPITSDATLVDGRYVGLDKVADKVIEACGDSLGLDWKGKTKEFCRELKKADLIIAKGQANFYVFEKYRRELKIPVVLLFRTKCDLAAGYFRQKGTINIAAIL